MSNNRYFKAVSKGMVMTIPFSITGSMLTLLANIPFDGYQNFIDANGLRTLSSFLVLDKTILINSRSGYKRAVFFHALSVLSL